MLILIRAALVILVTERQAQIILINCWMELAVDGVCYRSRLL